MKQGSLKERLVARALEEGFSKCRITTPDAVPQVAERLGAFVEAGRHGQMGWMAERMGWRGESCGALARGAVGGDAGGGLYAGA